MLRDAFASAHGKRSRLYKPWCDIISGRYSNRLHTLMALSTKPVVTLVRCAWSWRYFSELSVQKSTNLTQTSVPNYGCKNIVITAAILLSEQRYAAYIILLHNQTSWCLDAKDTAWHVCSFPYIVSGVHAFCTLSAHTYILQVGHWGWPSISVKSTLLDTTWSSGYALLLLATITSLHNKW